MVFKSLLPVKWLRSHLDAIDREYIQENTDDKQLLSVTYLSGLMLLLLNYLVINYRNQYEAAVWVAEQVGAVFGPDAGNVWFDHIALIMKGTWSAGCVLLYFVIPGLFTRFVLKRKLTDLGISPRGSLKHLPMYLLLFLPVIISVWFVSFRPEFQKTYPFYHNPASMTHLLLWEFMYGIQFFSLEFFFRGFMLTGWRERFGWRAVLFMVIPYCMIHFPKPGLEATGAIIAGSVLGVLALRTRSIWGGVAIHVTVAWSMDMVSLYQRGWFG